MNYVYNTPFLMSDAIERAYSDPMFNEYGHSRKQQNSIMNFTPFSPLLMYTAFDRAYSYSYPDSLKPLLIEKLAIALGRALRKGVLAVRHSLSGSSHAHA